MENTETIDLAVDVTKAEDGLQAIAKSLTGLGNVAKEAGAEIAKAFAPVANSLQKTEKKLSNLPLAREGRRRRQAKNSRLERNTCNGKEGRL